MLSDVFRLIKKEFLLSGRKFLVIFMTFFLIIILYSGLDAAYRGGLHPAGDFYLFTLALFLFPAGMVYTSVQFQELHDKRTGITELTLPVSPGARMAAPYLISGVFFPLVSALIIILGSLVSEHLTSRLFTLGPSFFPHKVIVPGNGKLWLTLIHYLILHSIFFAGAAAFEKNSFLKVLLGLILFLLAYGFLSLLFAYALFKDILPFDSVRSFLNIQDSLASLSPVISQYLNALVVIFMLVYLLILPFFLIIASLKLKEKEIA